MRPPQYEIQYCKHYIITNLMNLQFPDAKFNSDLPHGVNNAFYLVKYWLALCETVQPTFPLSLILR